MTDPNSPRKNIADELRDANIPLDRVHGRATIRIDELKFPQDAVYKDPRLGNVPVRILRAGDELEIIYLGPYTPVFGSPHVEISVAAPLSD